MTEQYTEELIYSFFSSNQFTFQHSKEQNFDIPDNIFPIIAWFISKILFLAETPTSVFSPQISSSLMF